MVELHTELVAADALSGRDRDAMYALMEAVYDGMHRDRFEADLDAKDACIVLRTPDGRIAGFSTQRWMTIEVDGIDVHGVFSGDTVVDPACWGSPALMQAFAGAYIADRTPPLYWFLISKGHRTYRMLTTFFQTFYPRRDTVTPPWAQQIMATYATDLYPSQFQSETGVLAYHEQKDRLRDGVAGITERELRNREVAFFAAANPGWEQGHDLVCLCELTVANVQPRMRSVLGVG